jgi:uncharacterized membrane protein
MLGRAGGIQQLLQVLVQGFQPGRLRALFLVCVGLVCFLFPFGAVFVAGGLLPRDLAWTASVIIILTALTVLLSEMRAGNAWTAARRFGVLALVLFGVEWLGVHTGYPFGTYQYTPVLGATVLGVPLAIPFAWYATVVNSWRLAQGILGNHQKRSRIGVAVMVGILTVALDLILEPMASLVKYYWVWEWGTVPIHNYLSWFVFSSLAAYRLESLRPLDRAAERGAQMSAVILCGTQVALFIMTDAVNSQLLPVILAAGIALLGAGLVRRLALALRPSKREAA